MFHKNIRSDTINESILTMFSSNFDLLSIDSVFDHRSKVIPKSRLIIEKKQKKLITYQVSVLSKNKKKILISLSVYTFIVKV